MRGMEVSPSQNRSKSSGVFDSTHVSFVPSEERTSLDEVKEVMHMPDFDAETAKALSTHRSVVVSAEVVRDMKEYVSIIAGSYRKNPFHSFQHACHVTVLMGDVLVSH